MAARSDSQRFARVRRLFEEALELQPNERRAFVRQATAAEPELEPELERLLAAVREHDEFLTPPTASRVGATYAPAPTLTAGDVVGDYTIESLLGSGGMGAVYAATQRRPSRSVALKLLGLMPTPDIARRFELEGEILARLRHPGIAAIHELGLYRTPAGHEVPFLAMELIEGARDLVTYVREQGLALEARLALFRQVCAAAHHAHQRGVIHRDLKPGNVLVDSAGHPKLIDYGIARLSEPSTTDATTTRTGALLGTLQYASPEQLSGAVEAIDVRSDVYSLGLMLYELVSDRRPYEVAGRPITEVVAEVCEREPVPPSRVAPNVPRELDWVVMKAIAKDRERRYDSAAELALDLERFAADQPLLAGPPTARYVVSKFLSRHRVAVALTALILLSLLAGFAATWLALVEARKQSARADAALQAEKRQAERTASALERQTAVLDALGTTLGALEPGQDGRHVTLAELLERRSAQLAVDEHVEPEVRASLQGFLTQAYFNLGLLEPASTAAEGGLEALAASREVDLAMRARLHGMLSRLRILAGRLDDAEVELELTIADLSALDRLESSEGVEVYRLRGELLEKRGRIAEAAEQYSEVIPRAERVLGPDDPVTLRILSESAMLFSSLRRFDLAEANAREAYERSRRALGPDHPLTLPAAMRYGLILQQLGKTEALVPLQRDVVDGALRAFGEQHRNVPYAMYSLASAQLATRDAAGAEATARRALELAGRHHPDDDEIDGIVRIPLSNALVTLGREAEALELLEVGVQRLASGPLAAHPLLVDQRGMLASLYAKLGRVDDAVREYSAAVEGAERSFPPEHPNVVLPKGQRALLRVSANGDAGAVGELRDACELLVGALRPDQAAAGRTMAAELAKWYAAHGAEADRARFAKLAEPPSAP
ncbi:MAG: protein kinase [Planctomycetes bacterium]|nr:protein kinase [Planctomycetota bacterium]